MSAVLLSIAALPHCLTASLAHCKELMMSGSQYIALSGLRARVDDLDRLADDIANVGTAGYKGERQARAAAERVVFADTLQTAIDTTFGGQKLDTTAGAFAMTGRSLDIAIDGDGFF